MTLAASVTQTASSKIWTRVAGSISYHGSHFVKRLSINFKDESEDNYYFPFIHVNKLALYLFIYYLFGTPRVVSKIELAKLHDWVPVSLGAPVIRPCATTEQNA